MAEVAEENQINMAALRVRKIVVAGEAGGSLPHVRRRIEKAFDAEVIDHAGASEVGPWGYSDMDRQGLHVNESEFIAEFLSVASGEPASDGELAELVLTPLGRLGSPVIRYRTGDLVRPRVAHGGRNQFVLLEGGVLGRSDDMFIVRGVNIFPSSIDQILRGFPEVVEYRAVVTRSSNIDALTVEIEDRLAAPDRVAQELRLRLGLKVDVRCVPLGTLPRFEGKGCRLVDRRGEPGDWQV
jgi:phenylacetate-CoA ligase